MAATKTKARVQLSERERAQLRTLIGTGEAAGRLLAHARILLKADEGDGGPGWTDPAVATAVEVSAATVARVRQRYVAAGLEAALERKAPAREYRRKLDGEQEAHLVALACASPPDGQARWSLRLLAQRLVELGQVETVSHETVRQVLKQTTSSHG